MSTPLRSGTRLGPYEIVALIGAGGMGEVYRGRDTRLDRSVAIKVLPRTFADDPDRRSRFEREARLVANVAHPNVCALHDVGSVSVAPGEDVSYLVMEHLAGETLDTRIARGPLPVDAEGPRAAVAVGARRRPAARFGIGIARRRARRSCGPPRVAAVGRRQRCAGTCRRDRTRVVVRGAAAV